jgi:hypothetical protein
MKTTIFYLVLAGALLHSCNNAGNKQTAIQKSEAVTTPVNNDSSRSALNGGQTATSKDVLKDIIDGYLQLKNDLAQDNTTSAAKSGGQLKSVISGFNSTTLNDTQKKIFNDIKDDVIENSEHIAESGGKLAHQREHFEILSKDIYDLVKAFGPGRVLYKDFCPMYNDGKGAFWLSETKEIANPYLGKSMPTCGNVQEELK